MLQKENYLDMIELLLELVIYLSGIESGNLQSNIVLLLMLSLGI